MRDDHRVQLVPSVDNMKASVSGRERMNGVAESGSDLLEIDVFNGTKSVGAENRFHIGRPETTGRAFTHFLKLLGPLLFYLPQLF